MINSPHLQSAVELDKALYDLGLSLGSQKLPDDPQTEADVERIMDVVKNRIIPDLKLWEYYVIDVEKTKVAFGKAWSEGGGKKVANGTTNGNTNEPNLASLGRKEAVDHFVQTCLPEDWDALGSRFKLQTQHRPFHSFRGSTHERSTRSVRCRGTGNTRAGSIVRRIQRVALRHVR